MTTREILEPILDAFPAEELEEYFLRLHSSNSRWFYNFMALQWGDEEILDLIDIDTIRDYVDAKNRKDARCANV